MYASVTATKIIEVARRYWEWAINDPPEYPHTKETIELIVSELLGISAEAAHDMLAGE